MFNSFSRLVDEMPEQGIFGVLELERRMIGNDLAEKRTLPVRESRSILSFCQFVAAARHGSQISPVALPVKHVAFYRKTVRRLIEAELLPFEAVEHFDSIFSQDLYQSAA
jgi:hypothetical protein